MMLTSKENNKALENLNDKLLAIINDRGMISSSLLSPLSKITNAQNTIQFKLVKDSNSNRVNDLLIHNTITDTLCNNLLTFRDTSKEFELKKDLLKMLTNRNYNVGLASLSVEKFLHDCAKKNYFDVKAQGNKSTQSRTPIKLPKSPGLTISSSGNSNKIFLTSDPNEKCDRLKLLL